LSRALNTVAAKLAIHLKVDTGMGRMGMQATTQRVDDVLAVAALPHLELSGIFSHFAAADSRDKTHAWEQFRRFHDFLAGLDQAGLKIPLEHMANSGAIIDMPGTHLDMVRAGISVYGLYPSDEVDKTRIALRPAMRITASIAHLKKVPAGFKVSYGSTWQSKSPTTIATIPIGYADGYSRLLSNRGSMLVRGKRAPIAGRVCMDLTMLDVGHIPGVAAGDEVVALGDQGDEQITADEIADLLGTINYEVVSALTARIPRVYRK
jgi:alanine racemase